MNPDEAMTGVTSGIWLSGLLLGALGILAWLFMRLWREKRCFQSVFEHAAVGIARYSVDRRWIEVNPALCQMLGYSAEQLVDRDWLEQTHPDDRAFNTELFESVLRGERDGYTLEKRFLRPDGSVLFVNLAAQAIRLANGRVDYFAVVVEDITQRQRAEMQFAHQVNRSMVLIELPREAERLSERDFMQYATERAEMLTQSRIGLMHLVDPEAVGGVAMAACSKNTREQLCAGQAAGTCQLEEAGFWSSAIGRTEPLIVNDFSRDDAPGEMAGHSGETPLLQRFISVPVLENGVVRMFTHLANKAEDYTAYDVETAQLIGNETWRIVRRQRSDKALRLAMQVVNASPVVCFRWSSEPGWPVKFVSDNVRQWGYTPEQLEANTPPFAELVHPDDVVRVADEVSRKTAQGLSSFEQEYRIVTAEKGVIWVVDRTMVVRDAEGKVNFYDGVLTDITERKQQQLLIAETLSEQTTLNKRLEDANNQLLQSEKMASIGQLAAGIAHELNNPIGFVHSNLGTLDGYLNDLMAIIDAYEKTTRELGEDDPQCIALKHLREERDFDFIRDDIFKLLAESKEGLSRLRKIVQDLKTFARVGEQEWQEADLHQGIDSTLNIVWNELKYKCQVVKDYGELPPVFCLISQLNQVFMNLLVNAGHAIEDKGTITIRTRRLDDDRVSIEISDTGKGIAPENLRRIFEPFFTTKPVGKGTGLGLSVSYNIISRHQGKIEVDSTLGQGTTFRVILPIHPSTGNAEENAE